MANFYSTDTIQSMLDRLKNNEGRKKYLQGPESYEAFAPKKLDFQAPDNELTTSVADQIMQNDETATAIAMIKAQNQYAFNQMQEQKKQNQLAQQAQQNAQLEYDAASAGGLPGTANPKRWGEDRIPEVSDLKKLNPNAPIVNVKWKDFNIQLNRQVAPIFVAFLNDLWATGYRPVSIGGYSKRNIAGTNTPSLHSYGFAIDIDPSKNPVTYNGQNITALPKNIGALAAKYGLVWGGDWNGDKRDTMHFSVPYGGTK